MALNGLDTGIKFTIDYVSNNYVVLVRGISQNYNFLKNIEFWENATFLKLVLWKILSLLTFADEVMVLVTSFASILHGKSEISSTSFPQLKYS